MALNEHTYTSHHDIQSLLTDDLQLLSKMLVFFSISNQSDIQTSIHILYKLSDLFMNYFI